MYRLSRRLVDRFVENEIPFTGVLGLAANYDLTTDSSFLRAHPELNDPKNLAIAERQLNVLLHTEDEIRERMAKWAEAMREVVAFRAQSGCPTATALYGSRLGMSLITEQICLEQDPLGLEEGARADAEEAEGRRIEEVASLVSADPQSTTSIDGFLETMRSLKYTYEPFEWVYEGLDPIMMRFALQGRTGSGLESRNKCTPAALALALSTIGERIGLNLLPIPAFGASYGGEAMPLDASLLEGLSEDAALRMRSKTQAVAPEPNTWLLFADKKNDENSTWIDCKQGVVVAGREVSERFPSLAGYGASRARSESVLRTWQGLVDLAIQAHTRRGESDSVAGWLYVKLSLDVFAGEWERALQAPEIGKAYTLR